MTEEQREIRRKKRILDYAKQIGNNTIACRRFGISRSTSYLSRERYREFGEAGLAHKRPQTHSHPNKTPYEALREKLSCHPSSDWMRNITGLAIRLVSDLSLLFLHYLLIGVRHIHYV
ncbi:MAG: helix-turn-helix domain-containing protein [Deltaproteobacteria bacterium]|jgi:transposase|nr:helix-turn-helix domain-containing protein [Deltaproteobacteria bacterium]